MHKDELLPCPFCGGEAAYGKTLGDPAHHFVNCVDCLASTNRLTGCGDSKENAMESWNNRTGKREVKLP